MFARHVLEVLYSPIKAFEEIIKKPDVKEPLLILVLVLFATVGAQYVTASRLFLQARTPVNDEWTELAEYISLWTFNGNVSTSEDRVVGNYSVESSVSNNTHVSLKIANIGPFNCSGNTGFEGLSFRIKWTHENATYPSSNATLQLLSGTENGYFELSLVNSLEPSDKWANLTVVTGSENPNWTLIDSPDWKNITGLRFMLSWSTRDSADLKMRIDDLYFLSYVPFLETDSFRNLITPSLIDATIVFFINWVIYAGILLVTAKLFQENTGPWKVFFTVIGYAFIVTVVYILVSAILISTLQTLELPMKTWPPTTVEEFDALQVLIQERWHPALAYQFGALLPYIADGWIGLLFAVPIRSVCGTTWKKALGISVIASVLGFFVRTLFI